MNRFFSIILSISLIYLISCNQTPPLPQAGTAENVFIDPTVGNKSLYIRYTGDTGNPRHEIDNFTYLPDTLEVEVMATTTVGYLMQERYTKGSQIMQEIRNQGRSDSVFAYQLIKNPNGWEVLANPNSANGRSLLLAPQIPVRAGGNDPTNGQLQRLTIGNQTYDQLKLAYDYSHMAVDGPGYHLFYSMDEGVIRMTRLGSWFPISSGWDYWDEQVVE